MVVLSIPEMLRQKKECGELSDEEIRYFVDCVGSNTIHPSQIGAMMMAVCIRGLSPRETVTLTKSMLESGTRQTWDPSWRVVDKHSTGGVGDKVTFPLFAALACFDLKIPSITGRGLGHTGGTADKLESIPGFKISLSEEHMTTTLRDIGCYITTQFGNIAPVDKVLYATRDITSTVNNTSLICASIMSKKLAEGINNLVLDVKTGRGSIVGDYRNAEELARTMSHIGHEMGVNTTAVITEMDTPIGYTIGNSLEIEETFDCLCGEGPSDLEELVAVEGAVLLCDSGIVETIQEGEKRIREVLRDGSALEKFLQILGNQGVAPDTLELLRNRQFGKVFQQPQFVEQIRSPVSGHVEAVDALTLGRISVLLGGGRQQPGDAIDMPVGLRLIRTKGDLVKEGEVIAEVHHNGKLTTDLENQIQGAFTVGSKSGAIKRVLSIVRHGFGTVEYQKQENGRHSNGHSNGSNGHSSNGHSSNGHSDISQ